MARPFFKSWKLIYGSQMRSLGMHALVQGHLAMALTCHIFAKKGVNVKDKKHLFTESYHELYDLEVGDMI